MTSSENPVTHVDSDRLPDWLLPERTRVLNNASPTNKKKSVVYWMQRDVRTVDNWALLYAAHVAKTQKVPLHVAHVLPPPPPPAVAATSSSIPPKASDLALTERHGSFLLGGLQLVHEEFKQLDIPLHIVMPDSPEAVGETLCRLCGETELDASLVVCDFSPLRHLRQWTEEQAAPLLQVPLHQVDAHNVVPCWHASPKREVGARTLRPKIAKLVPQFLKDYPKNQEGLIQNSHKDKPVLPSFEYESYVKYLQWDDSIKPVAWAKPGMKHAQNQFEAFLKNGLKRFDTLRNNPTLTDVCSNLSPWINHGHVSFQQLARQAKSLNKYANGTASYIEEGVVRRELSDNFVYYSADNYDSLEAAAGWAQETLQVHTSDTREYIYSFEELEQGETHDDLWNAAQLQLTQEGHMHGFLRMYWAKKILEWTESPLVALRTAQYFNDRYALDGNDPNGFVGVGWSIMGIHDMGWKERPIFGKIRYMNYAGCKRKFKVAEFVERYNPAATKNALKAAKKHGVEVEGATKKKAAKKTTQSKKRKASS